MKMVNGLADLYDRAYFPNQPEPSDAEYADAKQDRARCEKKIAALLPKESQSLPREYLHRTRLLMTMQACHHFCIGWSAAARQLFAGLGGDI